MIKSDLRQPQPKPHRLAYYATAVFSVAVAVVVTDITARLLKAEPIALLMLCAVISTAWLGGFGPAILAIVLSLFAFYYNLVPPTNSFVWKPDLLHIGIVELPRLFLFVATSLFVAFVITTQRKATEALRRSRDDLQVAIEDQKRVEAALLHSEMYLTEAQRLTGTGSYAWSVASGEIIWSDQTFRIFGCDRATKPTMEFIVQRTHPEDRAAFQRTMDRASIDRNDYNLEFRLLMPEGSVKYVHAMARVAQDPSGGIEFFGAVTDVTVAREAERKLRRSEAYLAESQHLSHTSSWAWDVRRREFVYRSAEVYHLFGLDPERDAGRLRPFRERIAPEDRLRVIEVAQRAIREKSDFEVDFRIVLPDGSVKRARSVGHPVVNNAGDVIELVGTHVDVTEQYEAKERLQAAFDELKRSEDRLRLVIDTIPTLVWRAGPEGSIDFLNQPPPDHTGLSPA